MKTTVQWIFLLGYAFYDQMHRVPKHIRKAAESLMMCRTALLGGHVQECPEGHYRRQWYNSCKHRMCPLCAFTQVERWLRKQMGRILDTAHFHVIFTMSHELLPLWRLNTRIMGDILFKTASQTLVELLADEKYLGAKPGIIATLHTWSRTLTLHPHLHCLVTGGGLIGKKFKSVSKGYLLPFAVVRDKFRGKFLYYLREALRNDRITIPNGMRLQQVYNLLNKLGRKKWNVHVKETYAHGQGVLIYLSRYLRGGPISNKRIVNIKDGNVIFNSGRKKRHLLTLSLCEFIERFVQHIPEKNEVRVRTYGLYHHNCKSELEYCRQLLGQGPIEEQEYLDWQQICETQGDSHPERCPECGLRLVAVRPPVKSIRQRKSTITDIPQLVMQLAA